MASLADLQGSGGAPKKNFFDFLKKGKGKARRASLTFGVPSKDEAEADDYRPSRRLSMPGLSSLAFSKSSKRASTKAGASGPFVIKHPRYNRRKYDHHFVPLTVAVATWNVGGHSVSYSDLNGLKSWLVDSLPLDPNAERSTGKKTVGGAGAGAGTTTDSPRICPDMYVLGFQEIVDFNTKNVVLSNEESQNKAREWLDILQCILPREHKYQLVSSKSMVGILMCIFMKESKMAGLSAVRATNVGVGLLGKGGNKGCVAVSMRYGASSLCFMTAHLAAHRDNVDGRCNDYKSIVSRTDFRAQKSNNADAGSKGNEWCVVKKVPLYASIGTKSKELRQLKLGETLVEVQRVLKKDGRLWIQFKDGWCPTKGRGLVGEKYIVLRSGEQSLSSQDGGSDSGAASKDATSLSKAGNYSIKALDHDVVFMFGDLNFRLETVIDLDTAYECIESGDLDHLLEYDQLCALQRRGGIFSEWTEARIKFNPTFKYLEGVNEYDRRPSGKNRVPAWCDRIMWQSKYGDAGVVPHLYDDCMELKSSDHRPVVSLLTIQVQRPVTYKCEKVASSKDLLGIPDFTKIFAVSGATDEKEVEEVLADRATVGTQYLPPQFFISIAEEDEKLDDPMTKLQQMIAAEDAKKARGQSNDPSTDAPDESTQLFRFTADTSSVNFLDHVFWTQAKMPPTIEAQVAGGQNVDVAAAVAEAVAEARADAAEKARQESRAFNEATQKGLSSQAQSEAKAREADLLRKHAADLKRIQEANSKLLLEKDAAIRRLKESIEAQKVQYGEKIDQLERDQSDLLQRFRALQDRPQPGDSTSLLRIDAEQRISELERQLALKQQRVRMLEDQLQATSLSTVSARSVTAMQAAFDAEVAALKQQVSTLIQGFRGLVPDSVLDGILQSPAPSSASRSVRPPLGSPVPLSYSSSPQQSQRYQDASYSRTKEAPSFARRASISWFYRTSDTADVFGPFNSDDMKYWFENGKLPPTLQVRAGGPGQPWKWLSGLGPLPFR